MANLWIYNYLCITQSKTGGEKFKSWSKRLWKLLNHYSSTTCPFKVRKPRQSYENGLEWNHKWLRMITIWMANTCKFQFKRFLKPKTKFRNSTRNFFNCSQCSPHVFTKKLTLKFEVLTNQISCCLKNLWKIGICFL